MRSEDRDSQKVPPAEITGALSGAGLPAAPALRPEEEKERALGVTPDLTPLLTVCPHQRRGSL